MCVCVLVCTPVWVCGSHRRTPGIPLSYSLLHSLETSLLTELGMCCWDNRYGQRCLALDMGAGVPNSSLYCLHSEHSCPLSHLCSPLWACFEMIDEGWKWYRWYSCMESLYPLPSLVRLYESSLSLAIPGTAVWKLSIPCLDIVLCNNVFNAPLGKFVNTVQ